MGKAVQEGLPKREIEKMATIRQAHIDTGQTVIVGVNKYQPENPEPLDILEMDNQAVRREQIEKLSKTRSSRDEAQVRTALDALRSGAEGK